MAKKIKNITNAAVRQIREELDELEVRAKHELKGQITHAVGLLRKDLVAECRRRLYFIESTMIRELITNECWVPPQSQLAPARLAKTKSRL